MSINNSYNEEAIVKAIAENRSRAKYQPLHSATQSFTCLAGIPRANIV